MCYIGNNGYDRALEVVHDQPGVPAKGCDVCRVLHRQLAAQQAEAQRANNRSSN